MSNIERYTEYPLKESFLTEEQKEEIMRKYAEEDLK